MMKLKKFDIWLAKLNPVKGTKASKIRPFVIIQTDYLNQILHPSTLICPITSNILDFENKLRVKLYKDQD